MKVLQITNNYPTIKFPISGIFVKEQIDSLTELGIDNTVYLINGREKGKIEYVKQIFRIKNHLKKHTYDIIHCHHALSALTLFFSGYTKKNVVISFQNDPENELGIILFKWLQKKSIIQIFKNNSRFANNKKGFYLPNGVNSDLFHPIDREEACKVTGLSSEKRYVLFISSNFMRHQKRYDRFSEIINLLRTKYEMDDIEEFKLINIKRDLIPYYFNSASLHLLTSDFEGSPNSVKEAMACNIPVVATNVGNVAELLSEVQGSYVSKTKSSEELARLAAIALSDQVNNNGREVIKKNGLDIDSVAKKILNIYKKILDY